MGGESPPSEVCPPPFDPQKWDSPPIWVKAVPPHLDMCPPPKAEIFFALRAIFLCVMQTYFVFFQPDVKILPNQDNYDFCH